MSFNGTFGTGAGLTLPSFTNVKPTVYVSGVVTGAENGEAAHEEKKNRGTGCSSRPASATGSERKSTAEVVGAEGKNSADIDEDVAAAETTADGASVSPSRVETEKERSTESHESVGGTTATLEALLANHRRKSNRRSNKEPIFAVESQGKGVPLDDESSDEAEEMGMENEKVAARKIEVKEGSRVEGKVGSSVDNRFADHGSYGVDDDDDDDDDDNSSGIMNEKQSIGGGKDAEEEADVEALVAGGVSSDEDLIDQTLAQTDHDDNENDESKSGLDRRLAEQKSEEKKEENSKIDKEVEAEVNKIQTNIIEPVRGEESEDRVQLRKLTRNNSIKDIPNPPSNLKKQQAFDFQTFLAQFKSKDCQHAHKYLKSFLDQFNQRIWTVEEQIKLLSDFHEFLFEKLTQYKPFDEMGTDEAKINNCKEGLEKLIMTKVYSSVFSPAMSFIKLTDSHKHDKLMDRKYLMNTYLYNWVELRHLDLDMRVKVESNFITLASAELSKIDNYKSPRDKIVCILNSSKIIFGLIRQQETQENADSFVPLLIYVLIHSRFKHLYSNLQYIERFRNRDFLIGETSYYVSTLQIACNFIVNITKEQLTVGDSEYEQKMIDSKIKFKELQQDTRSGEDSPSQVLTKSAEMVKQSLSNSINSFIQNITADDEHGNSIAEQQSAQQPRRRQRNTNHLEVSDQELERIKQLSVEENTALDHQRLRRKEILQQLVSMFPTLDQGLIEDVLGGSLSSDGYNVSECVNSLLALSE